MAEIEDGLGEFDDLRLQKGGPIFWQRWWRGQARVSAGWRERGLERFNSRASCATAR